MILLFNKYFEVVVFILVSISCSSYVDCQTFTNSTDITSNTSTGDHRNKPGHVTSSNTLHTKDSNDLEFPISGSDDFKALPDHPIQLVRPDPNHHKKLEVIEENMRHLHYITNGVAVVAVVGKFHSGKSFLLNQLMGKYDGFGIGPTVRPHTMGIWMWGKVSFVTCTCIITCIYSR